MWMVKLWPFLTQCIVRSKSWQRWTSFGEISFNNTHLGYLLILLVGSPTSQWLFPDGEQFMLSLTILSASNETDKLAAIYMRWSSLAYWQSFKQKRKMTLLGKTFSCKQRSVNAKHRSENSKYRSVSMWPCCLWSWQTCAEWFWVFEAAYQTGESSRSWRGTPGGSSGCRRGFCRRSCHRWCPATSEPSSRCTTTSHQ